MSFQWIFDNAETISVNKRAIVGQTVTRNQTVRATSRGGTILRFTIGLPNGMPWDVNADYIKAIDAADRFTIEAVAFTNTGYTPWLINGDIDSTPTNVICVQFPEWTIFQLNQVSWSAPFIFYESI